MRQRFRTSSTDARTGKLQHSFTRIDAVDLDLRMDAEQFAKEAAITFADNQRPPRTRNLVDPIDSGSLQGVPKDDGLDPTIVRRDRIEAHKIFSTTSNASGVSRTRSARAVRSSRDTGARCSAASNAALKPRQIARGLS